MGSLSQIRDQIKTVLQGVANAGIVHDYERWASNEKTLKDLYYHAATAQIRAWTITREATPSQDQDATREGRTHAWVLRLYLALDDSAATEKTFQDLLESVATTFRAQRATGLGGLVDVMGPIQIVGVGPWMLPAGILCHYGEVRFTTFVIEA